MASRLTAGLDLGEVVQVFAASVLWRLTKLRPAGEKLVNALASKDETVQDLAATFLFQGGKLSEELLLSELPRRDVLPEVLAILGGVGSKRSLPQILSFSDDADADVAKAARDASELIKLRAEHANSTAA